MTYEKLPEDVSIAIDLNEALQDALKLVQSMTPEEREQSREMVETIVADTRQTIERLKEHWNLV